MSTLHDRIRAVVEERLADVKAARLRLLPTTPKYWTPAGHAAQYALWVGDHSVGMVELDSGDHLRLLALINPADAILSAEHALDVLERHAPRTDHAGRLECEWCDSLCHSGSGLGCDTPDAPWPCEEIISLATRWRVEVDG